MASTILQESRAKKVHFFKHYYRIFNCIIIIVINIIMLIITQNHITYVSLYIYIFITNTAHLLLELQTRDRSFLFSF